MNYEFNLPWCYIILRVFKNDKFVIKNIISKDLTLYCVLNCL